MKKLAVLLVLAVISSVTIYQSIFNQNDSNRVLPNGAPAISSEAANELVNQVSENVKQYKSDLESK
ncbi:hypothetical protein ACXHQ0_16110 [Vibrio antiquarius]|uniref:Uncharacterized protein n=1 Tax=Vibrio parahaemolyticus TaxID=670 RepID=A0A8H9N918_VIBPH|nr:MULTISPECIES: hypothetical protein [Vibrio harveyi group]HDV5593654.1 hypothetical protein [Vibrio cholerae]EGR3228964.1 hypothetical protein [Vibrio parahaemolyticus]EGR5926738.1 hypothetical protein [Vibrio parahaemolyticus]EJG0181605.1 hypothetical protein [Vibrio parahaemolyticus]KOE79086.1 hypothetical protein ACS91_26815 [Vibrio parahaemolyticus]